MTLPLTSPPRGGGRQDARHRVARWRARLSRPVRVIRRRGAALSAILHHDWPAALLATCACSPAWSPRSAPTRRSGCGGCWRPRHIYGLAALAALAGRQRGLPVALAISIAGAVIAPLAWMAIAHTGQPEVGVVIRSAGMFLHRGTPYRAAGAIAATHDVNAYNPYLQALAVLGIPHALFGAGLLTDPRVWFGVVFALGFGWALKLSDVRRPWMWTAVVTASPVIAYPLSTGGMTCRCWRCCAWDWPCCGRCQSSIAGEARRARDGARRAGYQADHPGRERARPGGRDEGHRLAGRGRRIGPRSGPRWLARGGLAGAGRTRRATGRGRAGAVRAAGPGGNEHDPVPARPHQDQDSGGQRAARPPDRADLGVGALGIDRPGPGGRAGHRRLAGAPPAAGRERPAGWRLVIGLVVMFAFAPATRFGYIVYPLGLACWLLLARFARADLRQPAPGRARVRAAAGDA